MQATLSPPPGPSPARSRSEILRATTFVDLARSSMYIKHPTTYIETLMNVIKVYVGSGLFAMGYAFKSTGLFMGIGLTFIFIIICLYCNHTLINCSDKVRERTMLKKSFDMPEVAQLSMEEAPGCCSNFATTFMTLVTIAIAVLHISVCCVYIVFAALSFQTIFEELLNFEMDSRLYMIIVTIPMFLMSLVRELKFLAPISCMSNFGLCVGACIVLYILTRNLPNISNRNYITGIITYPEYVGIMLFTVSGVGMTMPLRNEMKHPQYFNSWFGVFNIAMAINGSVMGLIGFMGYLKYGEEVKGSVTYNIPSDTWESLSVQIAITLSVMCSYALQFYLAHVMFWRVMNKYICESENDCVDTISTVLLVSMTLILAILLPKLGAIMTLTGSLCTSMLLFFTPQFCDVCLRWPSDFGFLSWRFVVDISLMLLAFVTMVTGVYVSVMRFITDE